jgi:hypothetical protein
MGASDFPIQEMYDRSTMDARSLGFLYPRPQRTDITLAVNGVVRSIWKAADSAGTEYIYVGGGSVIQKIRRSDNANMGTLTFTGAANGPPALFNGKWYVPMGIVDPFRELATVGSGSITNDTWNSGPVNQGLDATAFAFAFSGVDSALVIGARTPGGTIGAIRKNANNPLNVADWGAAYLIGNPGQPINSLVALERWLYVGKPDGAFTTDENGNEVQLTPDVAAAIHSDNGRNMIGWHGSVLYPHRTGLYEIAGELTTPVGIERIASFNGAIRGRVSAMAGLGEWLYLAIYNGTDSWLLAARERQGQEPGFGPYVYHSLAFFANTQIAAMFFDGGSDTTNPRLYFGRSSGATHILSYFVLGRTGGPDRSDTALTYATDGEHYFPTTDGGRPGTLKQLQTIEVDAGGTLSSTQKFQLHVQRDESGTWEQVGTDITSAGWQQRSWTPGQNDTCRRLKLRVTYIGSSATSPAFLRGGSITVRGIERPLQAEVIEYDVLLDEGIAFPALGKTAEEIWDQIGTWAKAGTVLTLEDRYRTPNQAKVVFRQNPRRVEQRSETGSRPAMLATLTLMTV